MKWDLKTDIFALMVGHGTQTNGVWDSGCTYKEYTEADLMLEIVKVAVKMLRKSGVKVMTDADKGNNRNMKSSVAWANREKAKLYMAVHCNNTKTATTKAPKGVMPLYRSSEGKDFAVSVGKKVAKLMDMEYDGAVKRLDLYELNATNMPSCILETGFIKADLSYLKDYKKYGRALAKAICKYIGVKYVSKTKAEKSLDWTKKTIQDMHNLHFKYKRGGNPTSWSAAKKKKTANCEDMLAYSLQRQGILDEGQKFDIKGDKIRYTGKGCEKNIKDNFTILHPHKKPKLADLHKGDICGYDNSHSMQFAGWKKDKKGNKIAPLWYSWSSKDIGKKEPHVKKTYTNREIATILRFK